MAKKYDYLFKIILIGHSDAGKVKFMHTFLNDPTFIPTIGVDFLPKTVKCGDKTIKLHIWDTAGQDRLQRITSSYYRGAHGIMFLYDVTKTATRDRIIPWFESMKRSANDGTQIMLVGNNCHLQNERIISTEEGQSLADQFGVQFIEASAEKNINVEKAFLDLTKAILAKMI